MAIIYQIDAEVSHQNWGYSINTNKERIAVKWVATLNANLILVQHRIIKDNNPTDNVTLSIYSGGTNPQNGTLLTTKTLNGSTFPSNGITPTTFTLSSPLSILSGTTYWFTWTRAIPDDTDKYSSYYQGGTGNAWVFVGIDGGWELASGGGVDWDILLADNNTSTSSSSSSSSSSTTSSSTVLPNSHLQTIQMVGSDLSGDVQTFNAGKDDDGTVINFELETQQLEFGNRSHLKKIADKIVVFTKDAQDSTLESKLDDGDYKQIPVTLDDRVNIEENIDLEAHYLTLKWYGETDKSSPVLEGFYIDKISDLGMTEK